MAKITAAEAYAAQVKADRRAAAAERRAPEVASYDARVKGMYQGTEALTPDGRRVKDAAGRDNTNKRGPKTEVIEGRTYKVTRLAGGLKASLAAEKAARTMRARRYNQI